MNYDPRTFRALTFHDAIPRFRDGADTPRAYLERCLETIAAREPVVKAFAAPGFVIAAAVEPLDQFEIGLECERGIDSRRMKRRQENAEAKALVHQRLSPLACAAEEASGWPGGSPAACPSTSAPARRGVG